MTSALKMRSATSLVTLARHRYTLCSMTLWHFTISHSTARLLWFENARGAAGTSVIAKPRRLGSCRARKIRPFTQRGFSVPSRVFGRAGGPWIANEANFFV